MQVFLGYTKYKLENIDVHVTIKPLEVGDYQKLLKYMAPTNTNIEAEQLGLEKLSDIETTKLTKYFLPKYCKKIEGIELILDDEKKEKKDATIEDILKYGVFYNTAFQILMKLFSISTLSGEDETNIKKQ